MSEQDGDKSIWMWVILLIIAMIANSAIVDARLGQEVHIDWFAGYVGYLAIGFVLVWSYLSVRKKSLTLFYVVCLVGVIDAHLCFDWFDGFFHEQGAAYRVGGNRSETTAYIKDGVRYYRTHFPNGTIAGTVLALIQWIELLSGLTVVAVGTHTLWTRITKSIAT